jgi:hypothetical protein
MAYNSGNFSLVSTGIYKYITQDSIATITGASYFSDLVDVHSGGVGSIILVSDGSFDVAPIPNATVLQVTSLSTNAGTAELLGTENLVTTATATADGTTTGTLTDLGKDFTVVVTSGNAAHIVILPAPVVGRKITLINASATAYELRSSDPATIAIGGGTGAGAESAIPASSVATLICRSATAWLGWTIAGATLAAVEAAA